MRNLSYYDLRLNENIKKQKRILKTQNSFIDTKLMKIFN
jgi:hypothetical protein